MDRRKTPEAVIHQLAGRFPFANYIRRQLPTGTSSALCDEIPSRAGQVTATTNVVLGRR